MGENQHLRRAVAEAYAKLALHKAGLPEAQIPLFVASLAKQLRVQVDGANVRVDVLDDQGNARITNKLGVAPMDPAEAASELIEMHKDLLEGDAAATSKPKRQVEKQPAAPAKEPATAKQDEAPRKSERELLNDLAAVRKQRAGAPTPKPSSENPHGVRSPAAQLALARRKAQQGS